MKNYLLLILALFFVKIPLAQNKSSANMFLDESNGLYTYKEVIDEQGTKDELYNRCASWLNVFFANPWEAAKVRDQASGLIKIKHHMRIYDLLEGGIKKEAGLVLYNAKIEFKDNRYRIMVDNLVWKKASRFPVEKWLDTKAPDYDVKWKDYLRQIENYIKDELVTSLKENMIPPKKQMEDDW
jgi:hypothetical protein